MTKKGVLILLFSLASFELFAQGQNNNWLWAHSWLSFNTTPPSSPLSFLPIQFGLNDVSSASVSSSTGALLFYLDNYVIKNAARNPMPNGNLCSGINSLGTIFPFKQDVLIVPDPGNSNRYYLFVSAFSELRYCIIDMTLQAGFGDVITTSKNILVASNVSAPLTAVKQMGTNNFWILTNCNNGFKAFLLSASGVNATPVTSIIGPQVPSFYAQLTLKANPQGTKVARTYFPYQSYGLLVSDSTELYDFNASTGIFSNYQLLNSGLLYSNGGTSNGTFLYASIEFSLNGNLLYRVYNQLNIYPTPILGTQPGTIIQYDLSNNNAKTYIPILLPPSPWVTDLQLAPNGKIYMMESHGSSPALSVINQPNIVGVGCNYTYASQPLSSCMPTSHTVFPNLVPSLMGSFAPYIDSQYATNVAYTTATLHARVCWDGNATVTKRGFYYGTSPLPLSDSAIVSGATGPYFANLTGLTPNTLYYYRAFATNANGTTILYDSTFHTLKPNYPPLIKYVHNKATCVPDTMRFVVVDDDTSPANTTLSCTSSNTSLLPLSSITITGADTNKVLSFTPTPYQSGTSLITLTATDSNGASSTQSFSVTVAAGVPIAISSLNAVTVCQGDSVVMQCAIPQGTTINWYVNATPSGNGNPQFATTQSASVYAVCTNAQGCATVSNTINATVKPVPQVQCTVNGPTTVCIGDSVQVQALSAAGYSYQWFKNTQLLPNATNANFYAKQSGDYSYVATLNGCSKTSNAQTIQVLPIPIASISTHNTTVICNGQGALLQATTGAGYTYQWTMNGFNIAGATNPTYTATIGSYSTVKVSNGYCARTSSPITITVNTAPVAIIHWNGTQLFSPISFYSYQWYFNGVLIPGATGQYYTPTQAGLYYVMVGNENGCKSLSPNYNLLTLSINNIATPSLSIYPNPTTGMLQVADFNEGMLYVYNAMGQLIIQQTEPLIDLSKQANGIYQIRAYNQAQELIGIGRVVKE